MFDVIQATKINPLFSATEPATRVPENVVAYLILFLFWRENYSTRDDTNP